MTCKAKNSFYSSSGQNDDDDDDDGDGDGLADIYFSTEILVSVSLVPRFSEFVGPCG